MPKRNVAHYRFTVADYTLDPNNFNCRIGVMLSKKQVNHGIPRRVVLLGVMPYH